MPKWAVALLVIGPILVIGGAIFFIHRAFAPPTDSATNVFPATPSGLLSTPKVAPVQNIPPQSDATAQELARLRAENERLKAQASAPPPKPVIRAAISGAAWLNRKDGESLLQRGLKIRLINTDGPSAPMVAMASQSIPEWSGFIKDNERFMKTENDSIIDSKKSIVTYGDGGGVYSRSIENDTKAIEDNKSNILDYTNRIKRLQEFVDHHSEKMSTQDAYTVAETSTVHGRPDMQEFAAAATTKLTSTDADGKYSFVDVAQGDYFLYATVDTSLIFVEWLIPVHVEDNQLINLDNSNATKIQNRD